MFSIVGGVYISNNKSTNIVLAIGLISLFIFSAVTPMVIGYKVSTTNEDLIDEHYIYDRFDRYYFPEQCSPEKRIPGVQSDDVRLETLTYPIETSESFQIETQKEEPSFPVGSTNAPMDSPWPMYCHDVRHTGRSPYSTADNYGFEKWRFGTDGWIEGGPIIDNDGVIYVGASDLYAVYPNGTLKWKYDIPHKIVHTPAIDKNEIIYFGTIQAMVDYLYAIYTSNGTLKWKFKVGDSIFSSPAIGNDGTIYFGSEDDYIYALYPNGTLKWKYLTSVAVYSSPAIASDGTIYFGCYDHNIYALYPNGTLKWKYTTGSYVLSSPAIGDDGIIYCGSHDYHLYALYPNNGTLKWKFPTGYYVRVSPCIADDGTIYCVSRDGYLYAVNPDGTQKWKTYVHAGTSPTIGWDGTIYAGWTDLYAINPTNGSVKWIFDPGPDRTIQGGTPCNSIDGTIYFGTSDGGEIIAVNSDGTEKWRKKIGTCESAPAIGEDGTVYIGSQLLNEGYLYAFGKLDPNAPSAPKINGQTSGTIGTEYEYTFKSTSPLGRDVYYYLDWGDGTISDWFGPFESGEIVTVTHKWPSFDRFTIKARAKDTDNLWGPWGELTVTMPRNKIITSSLLLKFLERFPLLEQMLSLLIDGYSYEK